MTHIFYLIRIVKFTNLKYLTLKSLKLLSLPTSSHLTHDTLTPPLEPRKGKQHCKPTNFFQICTYTFMKDRKEIEIAFKTKFRRVTLIPMLMNLFLQDSNQLETNIARGSQVDSLLIFASIGSPKYIKGTKATLQCKNSSTLTKKTLSTLTPNGDSYINSLQYPRQSQNFKE